MTQTQKKARVGSAAVEVVVVVVAVAVQVGTPVAPLVLAPAVLLVLEWQLAAKVAVPLVHQLHPGILVAMAIRIRLTPIRPIPTLTHRRHQLQPQRPGADTRRHRHTATTLLLGTCHHLGTRILLLALIRLALPLTHRRMLLNMDMVHRLVALGAAGP